jgi:hypothetical protein
MTAFRVFLAVRGAEISLFFGVIIAHFHQVIGGWFGTFGDAAGLDLVAWHQFRDDCLHARILSLELRRAMWFCIHRRRFYGSQRVPIQGMSEHLSKTTTDHEEIRKWAEERGAKPACVRKTGGKGDVGLLRLDFPGYSGADSLEEIDWDEWFEKFDENDLALVYQDKTAAGERSNFNKLVSRETAGSADHNKKTPASKPKTSKAGGK